MDPRDETSIATAIDAAATRPDPIADWTPVPTVSSDVSGAVAAVVGRA